MTHSTPPPTPNEENLDQLLSQAFRSQMPNPWPSCPVGAEAAPLRVPHADPLRVGRWTLAASVLALVGLGLWLTPTPLPESKPVFAAPNDPNLLEHSVADGSALFPTSSPTRPTPPQK